ncbi:AraC family transcriptional regulator [Saccharibacillus alkalitolerans]|uniref:Helix-turn-helix domain-containing protein n=1 Tax=Saccharibacillus alkalitolerans TaxID=2705290 RepID=A0ABX0FDX6_9BACL|nr:helix-turn-helix domain-containing protein [Saccharibacillus alkalitolerans]NGZ76677.1 helix-turn-helix domain-containing protein [Saccharibacillus alkalitolerans]
MNEKAQRIHTESSENTSKETNKEPDRRRGADFSGEHGAIETIERVLQEVERRITEKIVLDELAEHVHLSKFHLHRLIRAATGLPLMEYIRARRLSASARDLLGAGSGGTVLDVALAYGFDHEQSYIRSFKRQFGVTPAQFRRGRREIMLVERYDTSALKEIRRGVVFEPTFVMKPQSLYAGRKATIDVADNLQNFTANLHGASFFYEEYPNIPNKLNPGVYIGLTLYTPEHLPHATDYLTSAEVSSLDGLEGEWDTAVIPGCKYAVFKYIGNFHAENLNIHDLNEIWNYMDEWLARSPYVQSHPHHFEYIDIASTRDDYCEADLYLPIREA